MWVARDKDGELHLFPDFGTVEREAGYWKFYTFSSIISPEMWFGGRIDRNLFPNLKWEDEPIEVNLYQTNPVYTKECYNCGGEFKYHRSDIQTSYSYQPSSGAEDGWSYLVCPHCGKSVMLD